MAYLNKKDLMAVNAQFGNCYFENESSLDYALGYFKQNIAWTRQVSYVLRAILIDHVFGDGNKRTAYFVLIWHVRNNGYEIDQKRALDIIKKIVLHRRPSIVHIRRLLENAITKRD